MSKLKICHVGHGVIEIPPKGWGAVESVISSYQWWCEYYGHEFYIVNTQDSSDCMRAIEDIAPDILHIHCERHFHLASKVRAKMLILCSHWPKLYAPESATQAVRMLSGGSHIACLSDSIREHLLKIGLDPSRLLLARNGARCEGYRFSRLPKYSDRSIYLASIQSRKRQYLFQDIEWLDFVGPRVDMRFDFSRPNYIGEWTRSQVHSQLTDYANLVLLSKSEAAPLVTCEALASGLGVVVSVAAAANLDCSKRFVTVIPEERLLDTDFVRGAIRENQEISITMREEIRRYARDTFDWRHLVAKYLEYCESTLNNAGARFA